MSKSEDVDRYAWLEDSTSERVRAWTDAQNERTLAHVAGWPGKERLRGRLHELLRVGFAQSPAVRTTASGERLYFHTRREGDAVQPSLLVRHGHAGADRTLVDVPKLSAGGTDALDWWFPSRDGALLAWGRSENGSEESTLHVRDVATGADLADAIPFTKHASVAWVSEDRFFYTRHPEPGSVAAGDEAYFQRVYEHVLGRDWRLDPCVFGEGRDKTDAPSVTVSPDARWLVVRIHLGWERSEVHVRDLSLPDAPWVAVASNKDALFEPIPTKTHLYLLTNDGAPNYRLERVAWGALARREVVLPEADHVPTSVVVVPEGIVIAALRDAASVVLAFDLDGKELGALELPALGTADVTAPDEGGELFVDYTSFVVPLGSWRAELAGPLGARLPTLSQWDRVGGPGELDVVVERRTALSKDGTRVPMFVIRRRGAASPAPTVLYGYGGFNVNMTPAFSSRALAVVEAGGVWVSSVLRGGGEYGEAWHRAGMLESKQRVFDDFIACAEALVADGTTTRERLAVMGGSNGGLLVAAVVTQRPELFRAGVSLVPLTDMLRYHLFRLGAFWIPEYGSPDDQVMRQVLRAYSPYHNVKDGQRYPAMLFTSAESDSRVDPMHARKMAARLAEVEKERPILVFVESEAGHGQGKPMHKLEDDLVMQLSFVFAELGVTR